MVVYTSVPAVFQPLPVEIRRIPERTRAVRPRIIWEYTVLPRFLHDDGIDLLISPFSEIPPGLGIPSIAVIHDLIPLALKHSSPIGYTFPFWLSVRLLQRATVIVTDSEHTRRDIRRRGWYRQKPIEVIYPGTAFPDVLDARSRVLSYCDKASRDAAACDCTRLLGQVEHFILYVGGFLSHKDVPLLIAAFGELSGEIPHHLVLVGSGPDHLLNRLKALVRRLGLSDRVTLLSNISDADLSSLYARCTFFVFPSRYEGFGLPVLEAMACGAPVLSSRSSSLPEVGGDAVLYFTPGSRGELIAGMRRLLADPELRRNLAVLGMNRARLFSWQKTARAFTTLIERIKS